MMRAVNNGEELEASRLMTRGKGRASDRRTSDRA
jgi:hypothetical protein